MSYRVYDIKQSFNISHLTKNARKPGLDLLLQRDNSRGFGVVSCSAVSRCRVNNAGTLPPPAPPPPRRQQTRTYLVRSRTSHRLVRYLFFTFDPILVTRLCVEEPQLVCISSDNAENAGDLANVGNMFCNRRPDSATHAYFHKPMIRWLSLYCTICMYMHIFRLIIIWWQNIAFWSSQPSLSMEGIHVCSS